MNRLFIFGLALLASCQSHQPTLFERQEASRTGVTFENRLTETEEQNILAYEYFYNGGGVAIGDFNNDDKPDLYFTGNQVPNKLYLNRIESAKATDWPFEEVTDKAGVAGRAGGWKTGVAVADVNADGWLDIYVCYSGNLPANQRKNQLFINNGAAKGPGGIPTFTERAEEYGVADAGYSTQATFFDYDADGDLDLFVMNHGLRGYQRKEAAYLKNARDADVGDRLYKNNQVNGAKGNTVTTSTRFTDVSAEAGIIGNPLGYGLGVVVGDLNDDNRPDLFVGNDYVEQDYVYLNNGPGGTRPATFREVGRSVLGHMSYSTMGADIADLNNDARPDIFSVDMLPADNARQKSLAWPDNWNVYLSMRENGFYSQFMRNMLHLNRGMANGTWAGMTKGEGTNTGPEALRFSEIGQLAGVSNTDWSWGGLLADFDNDGYQDVFVSNGYVRDYTNLDFVKYYADEQEKAERGGPKTPLLTSLKQMPATQTHHFAFRNNGRDGELVTFNDVVNEWGFAHNTIACGSAYADLDGDGDLDLVTNNTNEPASLYRNFQQERQPRHSLRVKLRGPATNPMGLGAKVIGYAKGESFYRENQPTHGFQSSMTGPLHLGLGELNTLDSVRILWPDGTGQTLRHVRADQTLEVSYGQAQPNQSPSVVLPEPVYDWFATSQPLPFTHTENASIDFNRQILLPYLYSYSGPRLAEGDVNGDGRADVYVGGASGQAGALLLQQPDGSFRPSAQPAFEADRDYEDKDALLFDADNDRDQDLLIISGAYDAQTYDPLQQDRLYLNNGRGQFSRSPIGQWPDINKNGSCVVAADFDADGDLDVFVGGSVSPGEFPNATESQYFSNDGKGRFTAGDTYKIGLVTDLVVANLNADKHPDLLVVGEYMAPTQLLFDARKRTFAAPSPLPNTPTGFWNRAMAQDLDGDGDTDFVLGNMGQNTPFKPTAERPVTLYHNDFDNNGTFDPILTYFIGEQAHPLAGRDELLEQMVGLRKKFTDYQSYSTATIETILDDAQRESARQLTVTETRSGILENQGGKFVFRPLPLSAQLSPVFAITTTDLNADGRPDLVLAGNQSTWRIRIGQMDASYGTVLLNQGKLNFQNIPNRQSGLWLTGDVRDLRMLNKRLIWTVN